MKCELISVGTELLVGDTLNTNVSYLSRELSLLGIKVCYHTIVGDNPERLEEVIKIACQRCDLIITTGGLGPTQDDLTKEVIAKIFDRKLIQDKKTLQTLQSYFENREYKMTENNLKQTFIPENAKVINNSCGTAPGIAMKESDNTIIMLPGPPREMICMFEESVREHINMEKKQEVISRYYNMTNIGESAAEDRLLDLIDKQDNPTIATYAKMGEVLVRITANGHEKKHLNILLDQYEEIMLKRFKENIFSFSKDPLHKAIGNLLLEKNISIAVAESCTGGLIASKLTEVPRISKIFGMGIVSYSNAVKQKLLHVKEDTLLKYGAVSDETAREMCDNLKELSQADLTVSVTGIAGPSGGSKEKPIGLVYIGVNYKGVTEVYPCHFKGDREMIQIKTSNKVFYLIRKTIIG